MAVAGPSSGRGAAFDYALRVAYLHDLLEAKARLPKDPGPSSPARGTTETSTPSSKQFDVGALIGRDASKSPKFPEKMVKVLDEKLQRIAMAREPKFNDQRFRRSAAAFWSSTWPDKAFQRQLRESRKLEELILAFVTAATRSLRKDEELVDGGWKYALDNQIAMFLELLHECLTSLGPIPSELGTRLNSYRTRLKPEPPPPPVEKPLANGHSPADKADGVSVMSKPPEGSKMIETVAQLYRLDEDSLKSSVNGLKTVATEQAALDDLKACLKRLNTDSPFPYAPHDFDEPRQWQAYRTTEVTDLSQMMLSMLQANPKLIQSSASDRSSVISSLSSTGDLSSRLDSLNLDEASKSFTYIPTDPRTTYLDLLNQCIEDDLAVMQNLEEDEDVSLGVLSPDHLSLLSECGTRWRLPRTFRNWCFLEAIVERLEASLVPAACLHEATEMVAKLSMETPISEWAVSDRSFLQAAMHRGDLALFRGVDDALANSPDGYHAGEFHDATKNWLAIEPQDIEDADLQRLAASIVDRIRVQAYQRYIEESAERMELDVNQPQQRVLAMAAWVEREAKRLNKKFPHPIFLGVEVVSAVLQQQLRLWFQDLEDAVSSPLAAEGEDMEEAFALYHRAQKMMELGSAFSSESNPPEFPIAPAFEPVVQRWLEQTARKTRQWADNALAVDQFIPMVDNGPSTSVRDLFDSFRSASGFLIKLNWPDEAQLASFATRLAKTFSLSLHSYCQKVEEAFADDMLTDELVQPPVPESKQQAWMEKFKSTLAQLQGEKTIQAFFNFTPTSCVKLNNIEAARQELDKLYLDMRVDDLAAYDQSEPIANPLDQTNLFTVKIVHAEGLSMDNGKMPDSFVIISDRHGNRYAKTRTIFEDTDPQWGETFDVAVRGETWFMATIRHRTLSGKHELLGRAYLRLNPSSYVDLITKDTLLPLDTRGHLMLRVSMEGERDDIQFHFGRAFRWLKRTESDMVRTFVDKMTPVLRHTLSRSSIKSVLKPASNPLQLDYNDALAKLSTAYRSAMGTPEYTIPAVPESAKVGKRGLSDAEIEVAIGPLFDYLDVNNHTLSATLSHEAMQMVMAKLWKQILMTIEGLIVPPLSDKPSHMRALSDSELDIALKWLNFLRDFFYLNGDPRGVPLNVLQNQKYNEIMSVRMYYDWATDDLMEECIRGFQSTLKHRQTTRMPKTLKSQRNLGTIKARKSAKRNMDKTANSTEMIMRILRMRTGTQEFLAQQIETMSAVKLTQPEQRSRGLQGRVTR